MGTITTKIWPIEEDTGAHTICFGLLYGELRLICEGLDELIAYHEDWLSDNRPSVVEWSKLQIANVQELAEKLEFYKDEAYHNKVANGREVEEE